MCWVLTPGLALLLTGCDPATDTQLAALTDQAGMFFQDLLRQIVAAYLF